MAGVCGMLAIRCGPEIWTCNRVAPVKSSPNQLTLAKLLAGGINEQHDNGRSGLGAWTARRAAPGTCELSRSRGWNQSFRDPLAHRHCQWVRLGLRWHGWRHLCSNLTAGDQGIRSRCADLPVWIANRAVGRHYRTIFLAMACRSR